METAAPHYVDSRPKLESLLEHLGSHSVIGLDTEFISEGRYEPALCLVQLSTADGIWIVDPVAIPDLSAMWNLLVAPGRELVTVAARQEIKFCAKGAGAPPASVLDLQIGAGLIGLGYPLSHTNLVLRILNHKVHGGESFTDWRKRPLSSVQLKYAADDVRYLLQMRQKLLNRAEKLGRVDWVRGECARLVADVMREEERWRVSGSARLNRRQLAALREVWRWRDQQARKSNLPASRVLGDSLLIEVAKRSPVTVDDLFAIRGLDRRLFRNAEADVVAAVKRAHEIPDGQLPSNERREDPPQVSVLQKLLSVAANGLAAEYDVDPALLATTADLQDLVRWFLDSDGNEQPAVLAGWRGEILREPLLGFLEGKRCVRVGNVKRANPLVFDDCGK
ncbi:MAG TPA: HRDC domain-containing protein [Clostridia bacterium]|nr:HRDC domain-containing protein [Clostridia bacterium]